MHGKTKNKLTLPSEPKTVLVDFLHFQTIIISCMWLLLCVCNHQRGELTSFKLHFYGSSCTPHPSFLLIIEKISLDTVVYFQSTFFWKTNVLLLFKFNQQAILSMACTYTEIFNNLFFRFFRNLCNILHECDSSATPENPGTNEGVAVILYHQNHDFGKYLCKLYISKHYLWWVSNAFFFFACFFLPQGLNLLP